MDIQINLFAFRNRFKELASCADDEIQNMIDMSLMFHDENQWSTRDYKLAVMLWAAHMTTLYKQQQSHALEEGSVDANLFVQGVSFGERSVRYAARPGASNREPLSGPGEEQLDSTIYGTLYMQVRARNIIPVMVV